MQCTVQHTVVHCTVYCSVQYIILQCIVHHTVVNCTSYCSVLYYQRRCLSGQPDSHDGRQGRLHFTAPVQCCTMALHCTEHVHCTTPSLHCTAHYTALHTTLHYPIQCTLQLFTTLHCTAHTSLHCLHHPGAPACRTGSSVLRAVALLLSPQTCPGQVPLSATCYVAPKMNYTSAAEPHYLSPNISQFHPDQPVQLQCSDLTNIQWTLFTAH